MTLRRSVALVGLPGCGKSTIGRQLARRLGCEFEDADTAVERAVGCTVSEYFAQAGEAAFRDEEAVQIARLCSGPAKVIATGGGVVLREENRVILRRHCTVVYMRAHADELKRRLAGNTDRPLLQVDDPLAKLRELYAQRDPLYRRTAHFVIETGRPSPTTLVNMVLMQLELAGAVATPTA
jgi:shikimate kinase